MFKRTILQFTIMVMLAATPAQTSTVPFLRDNESESENTSEESSEENSEEAAEGETASPGDAEKGEWRETQHGFMYFKDGAYVTGWNYIDASWYYFGADNLMKTDTSIGIYVIGPDGKLINDDGSTPLPHGEIYNSSASGNVIKNTNNITEIENTINDLYNGYINSEVQSKDEIIKVRYQYNALTLSEKARVHNEYMLAELENHYGITYDYSEIYSGADSYSDDSMKGNDFTFDLSEYESALTVVVRFPDHGDGSEDNTQISLITPTGDSTILEKNTSQIRNQSMNLYLTWTKTYLQIDIAHGDYGTWNIKTDNICSFATKEYAGSKNEIHAIPEEAVASKTDSDKKDTVTEKKDYTKLKSVLSIVLLIVLLIGYIVLRVFLNKRQFNKGKKPAGKVKQTVNNKNKALPAETAKAEDNSYDEYLAMKAELQAEYDNFDKSDNASSQEERFETPVTDTSQEEMQNTDAVEVTGSVEQFDESYLEEKDEDDWISSEYYFD